MKNTLTAIVALILCGISAAFALPTISINGLPTTMAVGDTIFVTASGGIGSYSWSSSNAGVTVTPFSATEANIIVYLAVANVTITATDSIGMSGSQVINTYLYATRIGSASFTDGDTVEVPVYYTCRSALLQLLSTDIHLPYDTTVFKFIGFDFSGTIINSLQPSGVFNQVFDTIKIGVATTFPLGMVTTEDVLLKLRFVSKTAVEVSQSRSLHFTQFLVNEEMNGAYADGILIVNPIPNYAPVFVNTPNDTTIKEGDIYTTLFFATDSNGHAVHYFLTMNPALTSEAAIDSITGVFTFSPSFFSANQYVFEVTADDGRGLTTLDQFTITVDNVNQNPVISTIFPDTLLFIEDQPYSFNIDATDDDGEPLKYSVIDSPNGMMIDSVTGKVNWTPDLTQAGFYNPTFKVRDTSGAYDSRYVVINVLNMNQFPVFTSVLNDTTISENQFLQYNYSASDGDNDSMSFTLLKPVAGMTISITGVLEFLPSYTQAGIETVVVMVSDSFSAVFDTAYITILNVNNPPMFTQVLNDTAIARFDTLRFQYAGVDPDSQSVTYSLFMQPVGATITSDGYLVWSPSANANGSYTFVVQISDGTAFTHDTITVRVNKFGDVSGNGTITSFDAGMVLRGQVGAITLTALQTLVGNVSGDSTISSADASLILQYVVGLINSFPGGMGKRAQSNAVLSAFTFRIAPTQVAGDYELFVSVNKPSQVFGITMSLGFDSSKVVAKSIKQTALTDSMMISSYFPKERANLALAGTKPLNTAGDIARFIFTLKDNTISPNDVLFTMKKFILNETDFTNEIPGITLGVAGTASLPLSYSLEQNYPNPFNPSTTINFQLPKESNVTITIYNMIGQEVKTLIETDQNAGYHSLLWDGTDENNSAVSSGVYFYKIIAQAQGKIVFSDTKKMMLLK
ncbi:MAG: Ig-like domain-containing protein [Bacteroidota bacterium]